MNFKNNFRCLSWLLDFTSYVAISKWIKKKSNQFSRREGFTSDYSNPDQDSTRKKNVTSTAITNTSTTVIVNRYKYSTASSISVVEPFALPKYIGLSRKPAWPVRRGTKNKKKGWKTSLVSYKWKSRCLFMRQTIFHFPSQHWFTASLTYLIQNGS